MLVHLDDHHRNVVVRRLACEVAVGRLDQRFFELVEGNVGELVDGLLEPTAPPLLPRFVRALNQAVGIEENPVARVDRQRRRVGVGGVGIHAERVVYRLQAEASSIRRLATDLRFDCMPE